ncbi:MULTISPECIES: hypothetical protein [Anaerotruncus]|uniref:hypothetical protein n=1 Tax=Anaerotruncus TaxID=244127 RepID=UPI0011AF9561|nr:hypothetical protein [Anaerotruncus massiliensis (ex Togo et al. 2019)]
MEDISLQYDNIVFDAKPDAVPFNYRISYKVTQLCLIMRICGRGNVCSLIKLHMISFALISQVNLMRLIEFAEGTGSVPIVRFDPAVNRALTYAIAYGLIERQQTAKYKLTDRGQRLAEQIAVVGDLMVVEISNLKLLAKKLTETKVNEIVDKWRVKDAEN